MKIQESSEKNKPNLYVFHTESIYSRGGEKYLYEILKRLSSQYTIILFLQKISVEWRNKYRDAGIEISMFWIPAKLYWLLLPVTLCLNYLFLKPKIKEKDVIFATNFPMNILAVMLSKKTIIHCFEPLAIFYDPIRIDSLPRFSKFCVLIAGFLYKWLDLYAVKNCTILTTLNTAVTNHIVETYSRRPDGFIPNGIDTEFFRPVKKIKKRNTYIIGHSTDYTVFKGTSLFIQSLPYVITHKSQSIDIRISESIHDTDTYHTYTSLLKSFDLKKNVHFLGNLTENEMRDFYCSIDVFCYTGSPECPGGSTASLSVLEAQACGTPVLRTHGTNDEIIKGRSGFYISEYTPAAIAKSINAFRKLPSAKIRNMKKAARLHVQKQFSWDKSVSSLHFYIQKLI